MNNSAELDLGPLTWVKGEIDLALKRAGEALKKHAEAVAGGAAADEASLLNAAQTHVHQAHGALDIVGLGGITQFTEAIEQTLEGLAQGKISFSPAAEALCQRALSTVSAYLDDLLEGAPDQALRLLPVYRELLTLRGVSVIAPADLFFPDLSLRPPRREKEPAALASEALQARLKAARLGFQRGMLKWLKGDDKGLKEMRNSLAVIEFTQGTPPTRAFWWSALAFLDVLIAAGVVIDPIVKKLCARIDAQIAKLLEGVSEPNERLSRDVLYYVATATASNDHVECVRAAYRLADLLPAQTRALGAEATAQRAQVRALREVLDAAKDEWNRYTNQIAAALVPFQAHAEKLAQQGQAAGQLDFARLTGSISAVANMLSAKSASSVDDTLALEVATSLLLVENALERFDTLGVDFAHQVDVMAGRLSALLRGETPDALQAMEVPHLDEISRKAQERLLMEQVVREMLNNLGGIEQKLDAYFREPQAKVGDLAGLKSPLKQIEGALTILGENRAVEVLHECAQKIDGFAQTSEPAQADFEEVANKLSALGFFVEQLRNGPADLDAILQPRAKMSAEDSAEPAADVVVEAASVIELPAPTTVPVEAPAPAAAIEDHADVAEAIAEIDKVEQAVVELPSLAPPSVAPSDEATRLVDASNEAIDAELLGIFIEEAQEVLRTITEHLPLLGEKPHDHEMMTVVRRAFHTLKGSGRMVGLTDLGEAAWSVEQTMNHWLKIDQGATPPLLVMLAEAHSLFEDWVQRLEAQQVPPRADDAAVVELHNLCARLMNTEEPPLAPAQTSAEVLVEAEDVAEVAEGGATEVAAPLLEPVLERAPAPLEVPADLLLDSASESAPELAAVEDDSVLIGTLQLSPMVYDIYLEEARAHMAVLEAEQAEWLATLPSKEALRASHTLGGVSGTIGIKPINLLGKALEYALERFVEANSVLDATQHTLLMQAVSALRRMLDAVGERCMPESDAALLESVEALRPQTAALEPVLASAPEPAAVTESVIEPVTEPMAAPVVQDEPRVDEPSALQDDEPFVDQRRKLRIHDDLDRQLLPIFLEEGQDLMREIGNDLRLWRTMLDDQAIPQRLQRLLHTLKGSARMAGAMRMGELVHGIESRIIQATRHGTAPAPAFLDDLDAFFDRAFSMLDDLVRIDRGETVVEDESAATTEAQAAAAPVQTTQPTVAAATVDTAELAEMAESAGQRAQLRVRAELVDQLINESGEMAIARSRIEGEMRTVKTALLDLTENVIRLRQQLREIEIQAETQMQSQMSQLQETHQEFDPLEMDRFTRFQELTRMMAESVNDVTTVQHNLLRNVDNASTALAAQARLNRELSQSLMGVRMVPFNSIIDRLYRVVRQGAKDLDKRVNLDVREGQLEIDRSVLEKMVGPIEHLLRNCIAHGIESREVRRAAGKNEIGEITISLAQQGNEIVIELADDGAGLNYERIRAKAIENGLLAVDQPVDERQLTQFIFASGFSTAAQVTEVAGRGVGMDVVKTEAIRLGGHIEVFSQAGQGSRFRIFLPLTLAVTQALLVRSGNRTVALPSTMVEQVMELRPEAAEAIRVAGGTDWLDVHYPWFYLAQLLDEGGAQPPPARRHWILLLKGADRYVALEVDGLLGNQEIVVKNIGPQLARVPGITGATVLNDGQIALILNPLTLASRATQVQSDATMVPPAPLPVVQVVPTIMVVDDSLTVRKIVSRMLTREGYQVVTAKDGVDALEQLLEFVPAAMLVDIEMPRMDGFELTRNVRAQERLKHVPIIMITSRIADKHRNYAQEIGVSEYMGKPYDEEALLGKLREFVEEQGMTAPKAT